MSIACEGMVSFVSDAELTLLLLVVVFNDDLISGMPDDEAVDRMGIGSSGDVRDDDDNNDGLVTSVGYEENRRNDFVNPSK